MYTICQLSFIGDPEQPRRQRQPQIYIVLCLCVFIYAVAKKPDSRHPTIKKPDRSQHSIHLSSPGQVARQIYPGIGLCVCNICVSSYARPTTRHPDSRHKKARQFIGLRCSGHYATFFCAFAVSINPRD